MTDNAPTENAAVEKLREQLGDAVIGVAVFRGETAVTVSREKILDALRCLKSAGFNYLADLCGADYPERPERFDIVYNLLNMKTSERLRVKTRAGEDDAVPSATQLWEAANWMEREAYDMYGVRFSNHPNLTRILMNDGFDGHPLRKDFPLKGTEAPEQRYGANDPRRREEE